MPLSIVRYKDESNALWATLAGAAPTRAADNVAITATRERPTSTAAILKRVAEKGAALFDGPVSTIQASQLLSPVTSDASIICQGLNYKDHAAEAGHRERKQNLFFSKASSSLSGPFADVVRPLNTELLDYEVEIGLVLRTAIETPRDVAEADIGQYVAGVVLCDDVSARDVMFGASFLQWFQGKSYRTFCPTGPVLWYLEPADVAGVLEHLEIKLWCNGELRQQAISADMIYKPAETLTELSRIVDLRAGDLLLTGTPGGVIAKGNPQVIDILRTHLLDDEARRAALRVELQKYGEFLREGDVVRSILRETRSHQCFGGQENAIK
jgi:2-keto-4-pentenoate hydratase/2-oxohepta-3-ene-1,7-dioic acid hydratase in catechol pathway